MSVIYLQIPSFVRAFGIHIQTLILVSVISDKNFKRWYYRSKKHFKLSTESIVMFLTYSFNKVPTGVFFLVFVSNGMQVTTMRKEWDHKMAAWWTSDIFCSHSLPQQHRSLIWISIDGWHLVEALGSATSFISQGDFIGDSGEYIQSPDISLPVLICPQDFACHMSSVVLTDIIQTVLETSGCFLSNTNNTMHILYIHIFHPSYSILPLQP